MYIKITNNKPNRNRAADATFYLHYNEEVNSFANIVRVYTEVENTPVPRINEPVTIGKYTFEIVEEIQ